MLLLLRAISPWLALSWLATFSLSRTNCSCLTFSCSTACLKAARSRVIGWSCCAKSEDRATAVGAPSFGAACVKCAGAEGAIIAVRAEHDHPQGATARNAANRDRKPHRRFV